MQILCISASVRKPSLTTWSVIVKGSSAVTSVGLRLVAVSDFPDVEDPVDLNLSVISVDDDDDDDACNELEDDVCEVADDNEDSVGVISPEDSAKITLLNPAVFRVHADRRVFER